MGKVGRRSRDGEEPVNVKKKNMSRYSKHKSILDQLTSTAVMRFRGSKIRHLLNKFKVSALAAVNRSRNGVLGNCPTVT